MVSIEMRLKAERRIRQLLHEDRVAQPDIVQYGDSFIHLYWEKVNKGILVNITDDGEIGMSEPGGAPLGYA